MPSNVRVDRVIINEVGLFETLNDPGITTDVRARAHRVMDFQKRTVPVDTGNLKNHIEVQEHPTDRGVVFQVGVWDVEYVGAVEFGRPDLPNYPRQPFIVPSLDAAK